MARASINVRIADLPAFQAFLERVRSFIAEYAWHARSCSAVDLDGEWRSGNPSCDCGYDQALAALVPESEWRRDHQRADGSYDEELFGPDRPDSGPTAEDADG